jgi:hypothetical protein
MTYPLSTTSKAIEAFNKFSTRLSVEWAVDLWRCQHDEYGKLVPND